jgi:FSR family fosmidomycin resistance protein-like MFS transporter
MLLPVLLIPLQEELGVSLVQLSLLSSIPRLITMFIYIPVGLVSDNHPAKILTGSFLITTFGAVLIPLSNSFNMLLLGFTLIGIGSTLYHPPSLRMASEFDAERLTLAMGLHNVGSSLGFAAGPLLLGYLLERRGWRYSFWIWAILTGLMGIISWKYTRKHLMGSETSSAINIYGNLRNILTREFILVVVMSTLVEGIFNVLVTYVPAYFTIDLGLSYSLSSIITGIGPLTGLVGSFLGGLSGDRFGKYRTSIVVLGLLGGLMMIFPNLSILYLVVLIYGLSRLFQASFMPLMNGMLAANCPPENRSLGFSFNFVMVSLFGSISITGTSIFIENLGTGVIFPISIILIIPTVIIIYILRNIAE